LKGSLFNTIKKLLKFLFYFFLNYVLIVDLKIRDDLWKTKVTNQDNLFAVFRKK